MTKDEAILAIDNGLKVTHETFTRDEWIKKHSTFKYRFEDGVICPYDEFWKWRQGSSWSIGWSIWEK